MPLVRIDLPDSISSDLALPICEAINATMELAFNVPQGDKFQIIARHSRESRNLTGAYLGIDYTEGLVIVSVDPQSRPLSRAEEGVLCTSR